MTQKRKGFSNKLRKTKGNTSFKDGLSVFMQRKKNKNLSERTICDYQKSFKSLREYLFKNKPHIHILNDIVHQDIEDFITYLRTEKIKYDDHPDFKKRVKEGEEQVGLSPGAINRKINDLKVIFNYLVSVKLIETTPLAEIEKLEVPPKTTEMKTEHIQRILAQIDTNKNYSSLRNFVILSLLVEQPPRISQLLSIRMEDVDLQKNEIHLRAENNKTREANTLNFGKETRMMLHRLILQNREIGYENGPLFISSATGKQLKTNSFSKALEKYKRKAEISLGIDMSPHMFRHFYADNAIKNNFNIYELQSSLGHKTIEATKFYITQDNEMQKRASKKYREVTKNIFS